jgi:nucleotide-binding universal stress UspA family protein
MKTIAVLTDFSERSTNAALYALQLARHLHANILLYHTFLVPSAEILGGQAAWAGGAVDDGFEKGSESKFGEQARILKRELAGLAAEAFRPDIACSSTEGSFTLNLDGLLRDKALILLVMANHHEGLSALMTGNHLTAALDRVSLPVLVVPEQAIFKPIHKIAFPTDLGKGDLDVLGSLAGMARPFHAEILLAHIRPEAGVMEAPVKDFLKDVGNRIDYPNIYYRDVNQMRVKTGLLELEKQADADLLVMVHRNKGFIEQIFGGSYTQKIAADPLLPLLIYPYPAHSCPVF